MACGDGFGVVGMDVCSTYDVDNEDVAIGLAIS